ncbi:MAG: hypothetical protein QM737_18570 [Ferruginibacter sp.]
MKIPILITIFYLCSINVFAQTTEINNLVGKWQSLKIEMADDLSFDINNIDSSYNKFIDISKRRLRNREWAKEDSLAATAYFQSMKSHFQNSFIIFNSDSTFVTNFFSDQGDSIQGIYTYDAKMKQLLLKKGGATLNYRLSKISFLANNILKFVCYEKLCEIKSVSFGKR